MSVIKPGIFSLLVFAASLVEANGVATPMSGTFLYAACTEAETDEYARGFCDGAIDALYSSMEDWCVPRSVTPGEVKRQVIAELLSERPEVSVSAMDIVENAILHKWPCS